MNFGRSSFVGTNDTPRFDMLGDAIGAAKVLRGRADMMAGARRDAAQSFADARIAAAKKGLASAQNAASGTVQNAFVGALGSAVSGGLQGGFSEGGIFNRGTGNSYGGLGSVGTGETVRVGDTGTYGNSFTDPMESFRKLGYTDNQVDMSFASWRR